MKKEDCLFCKIANGEIPSTTVYEDEKFRAFLDISPAAKGHTLVVTKEHYDDIFELDEKTAADIIPVVKKVAEAVKRAMNCDGINIVQNNGAAAGQTVKHLHFHIIPRFENDSNMVAWVQHESDQAEQIKIAEKIKEQL